MTNKNNAFNFDTYLKNADKVKEQKAKKAEKTVTQSSKPLTFTTSDLDSPLKAAIVHRINEKKLTYSDLYEYCTNIKGGDSAEGQKFGYNLISGLRNRHSMIDTTAILLCDFLDLDIHLVPRVKDNGDEENTES